MAVLFIEMGGEGGGVKSRIKSLMLAWLSLRH